MDFKNFLIFGPRKHSEQEQNTHRIDRARTRDKLIRSDMPKFSDMDGKAIYHHLADKGLLSAQSFVLWVEYLREKRNHR